MLQLQNALVKCLEDSKFTVTPCVSGSEAVDVLLVAGEDQDRVHDIDLVLSDLNMFADDSEQTKVLV